MSNKNYLPDDSLPDIVKQKMLFKTFMIRENFLFNADLITKIKVFMV
jgi:hypothetical protein